MCCVLKRRVFKMKIVGFMKHIITVKIEKFQNFDVLYDISITRI